MTIAVTAEDFSNQCIDTVENVEYKFCTFNNILFSEVFDNVLFESCTFNNCVFNNTFFATKCYFWLNTFVNTFFDDGFMFFSCQFDNNDGIIFGPQEEAGLGQIMASKIEDEWIYFCSNPSFYNQTLEIAFDYLDNIIFLKEKK